MYDMSGDVSEWIEDCDNGDCVYRVLRSGSSRSTPQDASAAYRFRIGPAFRGFDIGFRLARDL
jgi:formylglycine-generating enzyme required for sulfatase activity